MSSQTFGQASKYLRYVRGHRFRGRLDYLIFFVLSKCNLHCPHCFYGEHLNKPTDLSFEEIRRVSESIGPFRALLLSGGEPFLRPDLGRICETFWRQNRIEILGIPTNGYLVDRTVEQACQVLDRVPIPVSIFPSLDGFEKANDRIRGEGVFARVTESARRLVALKKRFPRLEVTVNTVITRDNYREIPALMDFVRELGVDSHNFELVRSRDLVPPLEEVKRLHERIEENRARYLKSPLERMMILGALRYAHAQKEHVLEGGVIQGCTAGKTIAVLDADGGLRVCEPMLPFANVREAGCDFWKAWNSPRRFTPKNCVCTHICFINATIAASPRSFYRVPYYALQRQLHLPEGVGLSPNGDSASAFQAI